MSIIRFCQTQFDIELPSELLTKRTNKFELGTGIITRNSSGDEIANVNFLYDDIVHVIQNTIDSCINSASSTRRLCVGTYVYQIQ